MSRTVTFIIPGLPIPQARAGQRRFIDHAGRPQVQSFDPKQCKRWKADVRDRALVAMRADLGNTIPLDGPCWLVAEFMFLLPGSAPKKYLKRVEAGDLLWKPTKPDLKNLIWGLEDALDGVLLRDDSRVWSYDGCRKVYGPRAQTTVTVTTEDAP